MPELASRFEPKLIEDKWYNFWNENGFFKADAYSNRPTYTIVIPPPNITGVLHMGHALNNTLQDTLIRLKRMQGYNTLWLPGTDHAGIATQNVVERMLLKEGKKRQDIGREEFVKQCLTWKEEYGGTIIRQLKKLGCSCDWTRERFTMDEGLSRAVRTVFKRLYDGGLIYRGNYIINWCPRCHTALADDEVEYKEIDGKLWTIKYPVKDRDEFVTVATTRPETMLGDTAVAMNPKDTRYQHLLGETAILPLLNRPMKIIADDFVSMDFGTGLVKVTPAHDPNDYLMGKRHNLLEINILTPDGRINENGGQYKGLDRYEARKRVVADLESQGLLEKIEPHRHSIGHCYRCDTAVEPYVSLQWFVKMKPLAEPAIKAVEDGLIKIIPKTWEATYFHWMRNVRDWCISRQLWWGHQIPAWTCKDCGNIEVVADGEPTKCSRCNSTSFKQEEDVLDTWFSSALWPFSTLGWPENTPDLKTFYPTSVLTTAHEILFFWVARMIMMGLKFMGDVPFRDVYIHPMVFDEETRKKMSKSLGNIIDPIEIIEKYGTDALRLTVCAYAIQGSNLYLSEKRFEGYRNFVNKLWNAARFVLSNTEDLSSEQLAEGLDESLFTLDDKWIISTFQRTAREVSKFLESYEFDRAISTLYHFVWSQYCDWYIEWAKPRLFKNISSPDGEKSESIRKNTQKILILILEGILRLFHPIIPFVTEELWDIIKKRYNNVLDNQMRAPTNDFLTKGFFRALKKTSLMVSEWLNLEELRFADPEAERKIKLLQEIIYTIRNVRGEMNIPPAIATDILFNSQDEEVMNFIEDTKDYIRTLIKTRDMFLRGIEDEGVFTSLGVVGDLSILIPLPLELKEQEEKRLSKELEKVIADISQVEKKLSNKNFIQKAPQELVEKEKEKYNILKAEKDKIEEKLKKLTSLRGA